MSSHNIGIYEGMTKIIFQLSVIIKYQNMYQICFSGYRVMHRDILEYILGKNPFIVKFAINHSHISST